MVSIWKVDGVVKQPTILDKQVDQRESVLHVLRQSPYQYNIHRSRWRLADLLRVMEDIQVESVSGLWRVLDKLNIRFRRAWEYMTSPDPEAETKLAQIEQAKHAAQAYQERVVALWLDELTLYRLPSISHVWCEGHGRAQKAHRTSGNNTKLRIVGALNHMTGQISVRQRSMIGKVQLGHFYEQLRQTYPDAETIYAIQDCWPVHQVESVLLAAQQQGIIPLFLPTYSSWRNPIEKVWRKLKQDVVHMHPWVDEWQRFKEEVRDFFRPFEQPNLELLRYVGLSN